MGFGQGHMGQPSGFKAGFGEGGGFAPPTGFTWTNAQAETYYNALIAEDPSIYDLYSKTDIQFKVMLNDNYATLDDAGVLSKMKKWCPKIGNTSALHGINAVDPLTYTSTFPNSATFNVGYTGFNGTNQYEATGFDENEFTANNNLGISFKTVSQNFVNGDYQISIGNYVYCTVDNVVGGSYKCYLADSVQATSLPFEDGIGFYTFSSIGTNSNSWKNGVKFNDFTNSNRQSLVANEIEFMLGDGRYGEANMLHLIFHDGLTDTQCEVLASVIADMDTFLGR